MTGKEVDVHTMLEDEPCIVTVNFLPGVPAIGPRWDHGGLPAEPPEVEIIAFRDYRGFPAPELLSRYNEMGEKDRESFHVDLVNKAEGIVMDDEAFIQEERY